MKNSKCGFHQGLPFFFTPFQLYVWCYFAISEIPEWKKPPKWPFWLSSMNHTWILYIIDVIKYKYFIERIMCSKWVQLKIQIGDALYFFNLLTSLVIFCMPFYRHSSLWSLAYCFHAFCLFSFGFLSVFRCYRFLFWILLLWCWYPIYWPMLQTLIMIHGYALASCP